MSVGVTGQSAVEAVSALGRANLRSVVLAVQAVQHDPDVVFGKFSYCIGFPFLSDLPCVYLSMSRLGS